LIDFGRHSFLKSADLIEVRFRYRGGPKVTEEAMNEAFEAIHDEALRLLSLAPSNVHELRLGLELIMSLARYKFDVRSTQDIGKAGGEKPTTNL
jgi:hypothetical protein